MSFPSLVKLGHNQNVCFGFELSFSLKKNKMKEKVIVIETFLKNSFKKA